MFLIRVTNMVNFSFLPPMGLTFECHHDVAILADLTGSLSLLAPCLFGTMHCSAMSLSTTFIDR